MIGVTTNIVNPPKVVVPTLTAVMLSNPPTDSADVIPKIFASICGTLEKFTGGLVTVRQNHYLLIHQKQQLQ